MIKQFFSMSVLTLLFLLTSATYVFADGNEGGDGASLMDGPFVIIAFATLIIMIYYTIRD
ncbi:hypothetical protein HXA31_07610 [Salipaludibacillus agaradhaerens]|uniref:Uncharacterized protein n=1 Tax=Salipaludibacillus agaradhaerens TaxID=76935 RepID=A0A9Q4FWL1_SALAG|nr:hypothetical protein [Salipaludibacillus agaradhaerens]MCR6096210.1 hypothetical protein [Salipaludibacillus agaradhaerens]MCR6114231.1 hypothetical protein [Salipaludibacillus agaradhaerens]